MALTLQQVRDNNPQYGDVSDAVLAEYLHEKYYNDLPFKDYAQAIGYEYPETTPGTARNLALSFESGVAGVGGTVGDILERTGVAPETGRMLQNSSMAAQSKLADRQSLQFRRDAAQPLLDDNNNINPDYNLSALGSSVAQSLPGMIATVPVGGLLSRGAAGVIKAAGVGSGVANTAGSALGFGAAEGQQAASQNAMQVAYEIRNIDRGSKDFERLINTEPFQQAYWDQDDELPQSQRIANALDIVASKAGDQVFKNTFISTGGIGVLTGGGVMGSVRNSILKKGAGEAVDGFTKATLKGMGTEAGQEFLQSGGEQYATNVAKRDYTNQDQDPMQGVLNQAATGALTGGVMGVSGGISALAPNRLPDVSAIGQAKSADEAIAAAGSIVDQPIGIPELIFTADGTSLNKHEIIRGFTENGATEQQAQDYISKIIATPLKERTETNLDPYRFLQERDSRAALNTNETIAPEALSSIQADNSAINSPADIGYFENNGYPDLTKNEARTTDNGLPEQTVPIADSRSITKRADATDLQDRGAVDAVKPTAGVTNELPNEPQQASGSSDSVNTQSFIPTHELSDGTPVIQTGNNAFIDSQGDEYQDDYAQPLQPAIAPERRNNTSSGAPIRSAKQADLVTKPISLPIEQALIQPASGGDNAGPSTVDPILTLKEKPYLLAKKREYLKANPNVPVATRDAAIKGMVDNYEQDLNKALADSPFDVYAKHPSNKGVSESILRQGYEALRGGDAVTEAADDNVGQGKGEDKNIYGVKSQPRLAETGDDLYKKFSEISQKGVVSKTHGIVYPVANVIGVGEFSVKDGKLVRVTNGGMNTRPATKAEIEDVHDSFSKDQVEIVSKINWGGSQRDKRSSRLEQLHSPRGNSFNDLPTAKPNEQTNQDTPVPLDSLADTSGNEAPAGDGAGSGESGGQDSIDQEALTDYTETELAAREREQKQRDKQGAADDLKAEQKRKADNEIDSLADEMLGNIGTSDLFGGNPMAKVSDQQAESNGEVADKRDIPVMTEEQYLAQNGASRQDIGDAGLHRSSNKISSKTWGKSVDAQAKKDQDLIARRDELRKEYADKVAKGELRPPIGRESIISTANGHPDNEATQAARRIAEKKGIDWEVEGGVRFSKSSPETPLFSEQNRLSNIDRSGYVWERILSENPSIKGKEEVTVYRYATGDSLRFNDYVAINKDIAEEHLQNLIDRGEGKKARLITQKVALQDLLMANDATEFIYAPLSESKFSKATTVTGSTIADIRAMLPKRVNRLVEAGKLVVVQDVNSLPESLQGMGESLASRKKIEIRANQSVIDEYGRHFETGVPVTFNYVHNTESATKIYGKPNKDSQFGRWFEPSGQYLTIVGKHSGEQRDGIIYGTVTFNNPLVIENDSLNWKEQLSESFGGKRGKLLSQAVIDAGYDGIVTTDNGHTSESINLLTFDKSKAKYSQLDGVEALYDGKSDKLYLVADMLNKDNLQSVLAHELMHRAESKDPLIKAAIGRFESYLNGRFKLAAQNIGSKDEINAYKRVIASDTPAQHQAEEFRAYLISEYMRSPDSFTGKVKQVFADFIASIRAFLIRNNLDLGFIKSLTPADLAALSKYGAAVHRQGVDNAILGQLARVYKWDSSGDNVLKSFAGQGAATADQYQLANAQQRLDSGEDAETVRQDTGWFKGVDGKWRFEIDDSDASWGDGMTQWILEGKRLHRLSDFIDHQKLFDAYPGLKKIGVLVTKDLGANGNYSASDNIIHLNENSFGKSNMLSVLLHEIQHGIQNIEGFASGGNPGKFEKTAKEIAQGHLAEIILPMLDDGLSISEIKSQVKDDLGEITLRTLESMDDFKSAELEFITSNDPKELLNKWHENSVTPRDAMDQYHRLAGEVEARNTQSRQELTAEQRRNTPPSATQDIADSDVIVMFNGKEMANAPTPSNIGKWQGTAYDYIDNGGYQVGMTNEKLEQLVAQYAGVDGKPTRAELKEAVGQYRTVEALYFNEDGSPKAMAMKAPNGQPTKLNQVQWIQTRTPNFKRWFAGSKVVDENGDPLVVYHGSPDGGFTVFDKSEAKKNAKEKSRESADNGLGFWFTADRAIAEDHRDKDKGWGPSWMVPEGDLYSVFLNITNPYHVSGDDMRLREGDETLSGYDGVIYEMLRSDEFVAFNPSQIKSATANTGAFKSESSDIRFSRSGGNTSWQGQAGFEGLSPDVLETLGKIGRPPGTGFIDRAKDQFETHKYLWRNKLKQGVFDQFDSFKSVLNDKRSWMMANISNTGGAVVESALEFGMPFLDQSGAIDIDTNAKSLGQVFEPLGDEVDRFLMWIAGNRAEGLKLDGRENLFADDDINNLKSLAQGNKDGKSRMALYNSVRKEFEAMHNAFVQIGVDTGLVNAEEAKLWKDQGFYIPFYRLVEDDENAHQGPSGIGGLVKQQAYKKLKGADIQLNDLLGNTAMNWNHLVNASLKNQAATNALESAKAMGLANAIPEALKGKRSVYIRKDGQQQWYNLDDSQEAQLVLDSLTALNWEGLNNFAMKVMRKFKRALTIGVTASPEFKIANLLRDSIQAIAVSDMGTNIAKNLYQGFKHSAKGETTKARMIAGGGAFGDSGYIHGGDPDAIKLVLERSAKRANILDSRNAVKRLWDAYQDFGARLENVNRMANFEQALEQGKDLLTANFEARDQLDFQRTGSFTTVRALTQMIPFLGARLQGLNKLGRAMMDPKQKKQFWAVVGTYSAFSVLLYLSMKDDDDYQNAEQWERDTYHLFKLPGSNMMYRLPRPFEVGAIANMLERGVEQMVDDKVHGELFAERLKHALTQTLAIDIVPQAIKPINEIWANKSTFTGRDIESQGMQNLSPTERKRAWTSQTAIGLSKAMDAILWDDVVLSPVQIEHLVNGYLGWAGATVLGGLDQIARPLAGAPGQPDRRIEDYPVVGRFVREGEANNSRFITEFYDKQKELTQQFSDIKQYRDNKEFDKYQEALDEHKDDQRHRHYFNRVNKKLSALNKQIKLLTSNPSLSGDIKREKIDILNRKRIDLARSAVSRIN